VSARRAPEVGVCILRIEAQPEHVLITLTTNQTIDRNLYSARSEPPQHFSNAEDALEAAAEFLRLFR
jgi:hypothetical protein